MSSTFASSLLPKSSPHFRSSSPRLSASAFRSAPSLRSSSIAISFSARAFSRPSSFSSVSLCSPSASISRFDFSSNVAWSRNASSAAAARAWLFASTSCLSLPSASSLPASIASLSATVRAWSFCTASSSDPFSAMAVSRPASSPSASECSFCSSCSLVVVASRLARACAASSVALASATAVSSASRRASATSASLSDTTPACAVSFATASLLSAANASSCSSIVAVLTVRACSRSSRHDSRLLHFFCSVSISADLTAKRSLESARAELMRACSCSPSRMRFSADAIDRCKVELSSRAASNACCFCSNSLCTVVISASASFSATSLPDISERIVSREDSRL